MVFLLLQFVLCVGVIVGAGFFLVRFGDALAEKTKLGRLWAGAILIATATSLPELFTGISSVLIFDVPDLTAGTLLGSCVFNLLLLVMLDILTGKRSFFDGVNPAYIVESGFALAMTALMALGFFFSVEFKGFPWIWPGSILLPGIYILAVRITMREGRYPPYVQDLTEKEAEALKAREQKAERLKKKRKPLKLWQTIVGYAVSALLVIGASIWLPGVADKIALRIPWLGTTVIGGIVVALTTSLPEIITTLAAFRLGAVDMAFSNIIGSNLFNILILGIDDMLYFKGPITSHVSGVNLGTALIVMGMTAVVIIALGIRRQGKFLRLSLASWILVASFVANVLLVAFLG